MNSSSTAKTILFWVSIVFLGVMLWRLVSANGQSAREDEPAYSEFMQKVDAGDVKEVTMYLSPNSYELQGEYVRPQNHKFRVTIPKESSPDITKALRDKNVQINVKEVRSGDWVLILLNAAPLILLVGFCLFPGGERHGLREQARVRVAKRGLETVGKSFHEGPEERLPARFLGQRARQHLGHLAGDALLQDHARDVATRSTYQSESPA